MSPSEVQRIIVYLRVSTDEQGQSGAGLAAQRQAVEAEAMRRGWAIVHVFEDIASGKSTNGRHGLRAALAALKAREADALVISRVDRLSRSLLDFASLIDRAKREGWAVVILDSQFDMSTPGGKAMVGMLAVFAEFERDMISERTKAGLAVKRAQGVRLGRPEQVSDQAKARIAELRAEGLSYVAIAARLTQEGLPPPRGGAAWHYRTVVAVSKREGFTSPRRWHRKRRGSGK